MVLWRDMCRIISSVEAATSWSLRSFYGNLTATTCMLQLKVLPTQHLYHHSTFFFLINSNMLISGLLINIANNKLIKKTMRQRCCLPLCCYCHIALWDIYAQIVPRACIMLLLSPYSFGHTSHRLFWAAQLNTK